MPYRRSLLASAAVALAAPRVAHAVPMPGITRKSIKIGQTLPYSGPASSLGNIGRAQGAYFEMLNASGGISGRTIDVLSVDDGYSPPRTVEETRRLVEAEDVAFMFQSVGSAGQTAVRQYLNEREVPQLFVATSADKWGDYSHFRWTMGWQPSSRTEAQVYVKSMQREAPYSQLAILYQNDDLGRDCLAGVRDALGRNYDEVVLKAVPYEVADTSVDSQIVTLAMSGADMLLTAAGPEHSLQAIRQAAKIGWHPRHYLTNVATSVPAVVTPAGGENGRRIITGAYCKDPTDPRWADDPGLGAWRAFVRQCMREADLTDPAIVRGYAAALTLKRVLEQCGDELTRENIMWQAANLHDLEISVLLPGIKVNTSPTTYHPIRRMQLAHWTGTSWELFGDVLTGVP